MRSFCALLALLLGLVCVCAGRVIYFNAQPQETTATTTESVEKSMLLAVQRAHCRAGYMHDHRHRCRRVSSKGNWGGGKVIVIDSLCCLADYVASLGLRSATH